VRSAVDALGVLSERTMIRRLPGVPPVGRGRPAATPGRAETGGQDPLAHEPSLADVRAALAACEQALADLAHETRGQMTVIKGRAQLMRRRVLASERPDLVLVRGLEEIDQAVDRLEALLASNLDAPPPAAPDPVRRPRRPGRR